MQQPPGAVLTELLAVVYVLSGVSQPLLMTICKNAGLADPVAQLFMVFYYLGPSLFVLHTGCCCGRGSSDEQENQRQHQPTWPSRRTQIKACGIAIFDIAAQAMNYTGASLAGPTIFSIVYASVTVWTAVWARIVLGRHHSNWQWTSFALVFGGLCWTARASSSNGDGSSAAAMAPGVLHGTLLVLFGSILHAGSYVLSEAIMTGHDRLSVAQNTTLQSLVACVLLIVWQFLYTIPHWHDVIEIPMQQADAGSGTTWTRAAAIMMAFSCANLLHSYSFYFTIKFYRGGSVMAGVMKGLQAALVFGATHVLFCGKSGTGSEMCFSQDKFVSLVVVVGGVCLFAASTSSSSSSNDGKNTTNMPTLALLLPVPPQTRDSRDGCMPVTDEERRMIDAIQTV